MYYSLRITPSQFNSSPHHCLQLFKNLRKNLAEFEQSCFIVALEKINKYGEPTHEHFHFNFLSDASKDSIQKRIRKYFEDLTLVCRGNKCYALVECGEPDDIKRWIRYLMKEKWLPSHSCIKDFTTDEISQMELLAKDEFALTIKKNLANRKKLEDKTTLFDKIVEKLEEQNPKLNSFKQIHIFIMKFYTEEKKPLNFTTIDGYAWNYMVYSKLITLEQLFNATHKNMLIINQ